MFNLFNVVNMKNATEGAIKFSSAKNIGFRPGPEFRAQIEELAAVSGWRISDIARVGLQTCWPEIKALVLASGRRPGTDQDLGELRQVLELCRVAQERGVDVRAALSSAMDAKLAADAAGTAVAA
jgi:hypothetical protein